MGTNAAPKLGTKAERTRLAIMDAAEAVFAQKGFAAARLEDVAEVVGIRRPSIAYYYKDKRDLYEAIQERVFAGLRERILEASNLPGGPADRLEAIVSAWVRYAGERPALAYMILREIVETPGEQSAAMDRFLPDVIAAVGRVLKQGGAKGGFRAIDPVHLILNIAGATCFFIAAGPTVAPELPFDPRNDEQLRRHLEECLRIVRTLLGVTAHGLRRLPRRGED